MSDATSNRSSRITRDSMSNSSQTLWSKVRIEVDFVWDLSTESRREWRRFCVPKDRLAITVKQPSLTAETVRRKEKRKGWIS
jgi:hypothetical protein